MAVRSFLYQELQKEDNGHKKSTIMRAVTRYYETKRQQYLDSLPARREQAEKRQAEKKLTSRRRRLFIKRFKVASGTEKEALQQLNGNFMSDKEDGVDNEEGSWVVRSPPWRSVQLSSMLKRLQEKADARPSSSAHPINNRVQGPPSTQPPPPSSPAWTVNSNRRQGHQRNHTPSSVPVTPSPPLQTASTTWSQGEEYGEEDLHQARPSSSSHARTARVQVPSSTRPPLPSSTASTVNSYRRQGHQRTHTPCPSPFPVTPSPPPQPASPTWSQGEECGDNLLQTEEIWRVLDQDPPVHRHWRRRRAFLLDSASES